jgi:O-antigen ligase/tetratricopeptide (TPR) repeat protein
MEKFKKYSLGIFFSLCLLSLLTPFWVFSRMQFPYITGKAFYFRIVIELALPFYLFLIMSNPSWRPRLKNWLNVAVGLFFLANLLASFLGVNQIRSLWGNFERMGGAFYLLHLVLLYFYVQLLGQVGGAYLKRFLQGLVGSALLITFNGISGWLHGPVLIQDPSLPDRASSTFGNPIFFASFLIIPLFLSAYFAVSAESRNWKIAYWSSAVILLFGIYISGTRGAVLGLVSGLFIAACVYVFLNANRWLKIRGLIVLGAGILIVAGFFVFRTALPADSTLSRLVNFQDSNTQARLIQWRIALEGFKDKPVFGVGPENYYVIFDKYFDPKLYQYDPSWFDKPHNFLIEVLVTNGTVGFLAYAAMFILGLYGLWRAYKADLLSLSEFCLLLAGLVAYQVQNLFVFDTVSPSVVFYGFLGLVVYMWGESQESVRAEKPVFGTGKAKAVFILSSLSVLVVVYIGNVQSIQAARFINYGYNYAAYDPIKAADYFNSAFRLKFNLDPREAANRYSDFVSLLLGDAELLSQNQKFVSDQLSLALQKQRAITYRTNNDPILWMRLAMTELNNAILHNSDPQPVQDAIDKMLVLSPQRAELLQQQLQLYGYKKDWPNTLKTAQKIVELNPYSPQFKWQLAMAYYLNNQIEEAVQVGDQALNQGFEFNQLQQFAWYIQYYEQKNDNAKVAPLLEKAIALEPGEVGLYFDLAKVYANLGNYEKARLWAEQVAKSVPSRQAEVDKFLKEIGQK